MVAGQGLVDRQLTADEVRDVLAVALAQARLDGKRILVIIPDGTRSGPVDLFFRLLYELLGGRAAALDYLIALGTHEPMAAEAIHRRLGVTPEELAGRYAGVRVFNHNWKDAAALQSLGVIPADEMAALSQGHLSLAVPVALNRMVLDYDLLLVCGPVSPHEVVGFSGGNKYFFPGIAGPPMIDATHWLGALVTSFHIIGTKHTPVRAVIDRAASFIPVPRLGCCFVVKDGGVAGVYAGSVEEAWSRAADLSARLHVVYAERPFQRVLSVMPRMYDDLWTAAKGMYKVEPVVADGGEVVIYAPHITEISYTHGRIIDDIGYHVRDYFVQQWERFRHYPWGVLAHSTHLRGLGTYADGVEQPRIRVTLATGIPPERCARVNLGYRDPASIRPEEWAGREQEGLLLVPHAGEMLYRIGTTGGKP